eukprot:262193-Pelagomonas_calceolata.AAC.3
MSLSSTGLSHSAHGPGQGGKAVQGLFSQFKICVCVCERDESTRCKHVSATDRQRAFKRTRTAIQGKSWCGKQRMQEMWRKCGGQRRIGKHTCEHLPGGRLWWRRRPTGGAATVCEWG